MFVIRQTKISKGSKCPGLAWFFFLARACTRIYIIRINIARKIKYADKSCKAGEKFPISMSFEGTFLRDLTEDVILQENLR